MPTDTFHNLPTEKRDRILEAAIAEFAAHPYDAAFLPRASSMAPSPPHVDPDAAAFLLESAYYQVGKYVRGRLKAKNAQLDEENILESDTLQHILDNLIAILTEGMKA